MNYDQEKAIEELQMAIEMVKIGMYASARRSIKGADSHLEKAHAPPAVTNRNDFTNPNPHKR